MTIEVTSQIEFDNAKTASNSTMIFYTNMTVQQKNRYVNIAKDACGPDYKIFCINIEVVKLVQEDVNKYQAGIKVVCCTVIAFGSVAFKQVEPDPNDFELSIQC